MKTQKKWKVSGEKSGGKENNALGLRLSFAQCPAAALWSFDQAHLTLDAKILNAYGFFVFLSKFLTMHQAELYQSVLRQLSQLPVEYLKLVDQFVSGLNQRAGDKKKNRQAILALAGSWSDLSEEDFEQIRAIFKETGTSLFSREIDL